MDKDLVHTNPWFIFSVLRFKIRDSAMSATKQQYQIMKRLDGMSPAKQEMDDSESLPKVKRQDRCVKIEGDEGSFWSMQESLTKRPKEALIEEQSSTDSCSDPLYISATTKPSKVVAKKDTPEQHHVYVQDHPKQDKAALHLDHVTQDLDE